jgi:hypothetical protein
MNSLTLRGSQTQDRVFPDNTGSTQDAGAVRPGCVAPLPSPPGLKTAPVYEYACHEGNEGLVGILAGARAEEPAAAIKEHTQK